MEHSASTRAFSALLNMSPIITMPPRDHWPKPPSSGSSNWAWLPPLRASAAASRSAVAAEMPFRPATSATRACPSAVSLIVHPAPVRTLQPEP